MSRIHGKQKCVRGTMGCPSFLELEISTTAVRTRFLSSFRRKGEKGGGRLLFEASIYAKSCAFEASVKKEEGRGEK